MIKVEKALRLPTFSEAVPIVLGNGEAFHFRPPTFGVYPEVSGRSVIHRIKINYGVEWETRFNEAIEREIASKNIITDVWWFADIMLLENYKPEIRTYYRKLLYFNHRQPDTVRRHLQIWDVVKGNDPKGLSSDGSATPSERIVSTRTG